MPTNISAKHALICVSLIISACSHTPGPEDIPSGASFTSNILSDGTKLFIYSLGRSGKNGTQPAEEGSSPTDDSDGNSRSGRGHGSHGGTGRNQQSEKEIQKGVTALLAQNHYCREGYLILEQYQEHAAFVVRGECRDAANDSDRAKFSH